MKQPGFYVVSIPPDVTVSPVTFELVKRRLRVSFATAALTPSTTHFTARAQADVQDLITIRQGLGVGWQKRWAG